MSECMKYPLIGFGGHGDNNYAYLLEEMLKNKCNEYGKLLVNEYTHTSPEYVILTTTNGESFGIVIHKEQRFSKRNLLHKKGYKSHRISYSLEDFGPQIEEMNEISCLEYDLHTTIDKMIPKTFTKMEAYTLDTDGKLIGLGTFSYMLSKGKKNSIEAYIDGVHVEKEYRGYGISRAMQDYAHLRFTNENVSVVKADLMKIDVEYLSENTDPLRNPYTPYFHMLVGIPDGKKIRGVPVDNPPTQVYGYKVESTKQMHNSWNGVTPVMAQMKDIKLNTNVLLSHDEFVKNRMDDKEHDLMM